MNDMYLFHKALMYSIVILGLSSCATLTRGTKDAFVINSTPNNVTITTSHGYFCNAPCALKLPRKEGFVVTAKKNGYCTQTINVISSVGGQGGAAMAGNVILGGLIGAGVDLGTGAMNDLSPNPLTITMEQCEKSDSE